MEHLICDNKKTNIKNWECCMDDSIFLNNKVDISSERATIWRVCNQLRGPYGSTDYANIIIPFTVLRRFDCSIKDTKAAVVAEYQSHPDVSDKKLTSIAGRQLRPVDKMAGCAFVTSCMEMQNDIPAATKTW